MPTTTVVTALDTCSLETLDSNCVAVTARILPPFFVSCRDLFRGN